MASNRCSSSPVTPGKVNAVRFTHDGKRLVTASGIVGLFGEARVYDVG